MCHLLCTALLFGVPFLALFAAEPSAEVKALLDKAILAQGGVEKINAVKAEKWKAKGAMVAGGQNVTYEIVYIYQAPNRFRFDMEIDLGGKKLDITAATDGTTAWEKSGPLVREMAKEKQIEFHHNLYAMGLSQLTRLYDKDMTLSLLPETKEGNKTLVGIKVSHPKQRDVSLYFDKQTHLLAKVTSRVFDEFQKKEVSQDALFTNYKKKDGRWIFEKFSLKRDGMDFIHEDMSNQETPEQVDAKLFAKPEK